MPLTKYITVAEHGGAYCKECRHWIYTPVFQHDEQELMSPTDRVIMVRTQRSHAVGIHVVAMHMEVEDGETTSPKS